MSSVAAASALVGRGFRPVLLDVGLGPDAAAVELKRELGETPADHWQPQALHRLKTVDAPSICGIPRKRWFGSDFPFRALSDDRELEGTGVSMSRSYARGGFSNVWGASFKTPDPVDLMDWPMDLEGLGPHFAAVRTLMGLDDPSPVSPCEDGGNADSLRLSRQARDLLADARRHGERLKRAGIRVAPSQLAVRNGHSPGNTGCHYCGLCLFGCPYDCVYSAAKTLEDLRQSDRIDYRPGFLVERIQGRGARLQVQVWNLEQARREQFEASLILVGAGVLSTARIVLESLEHFDRPLTILHSDHFTLPFLRFRGSESVFEEELHTLAQLFVEIEDRSIEPRRLHLQIYTFNELYRDLIRQQLGPFAPFSGFAVRKAVARLLAIFGYLPSQVSSSIELVLESGGARRILLRGRPHPRSDEIARRVARKLRRHWRQLGGLPLVSRTTVDLPGGGYHSGGIFPMSEEPAFPRTDLLGRLPEFEHVHLIDASVLPTIPAIPTAVTVMANAHRIASLCPVPR